MSVIIEARDDLVKKLKTLQPGSAEILRQANAIQVLSDIDREEKKLELDIAKEENRKMERSSELEFEREKEETRKLEKSNEYVCSKADAELRKIDLAIHAIDVFLNPGSRLLGIFLNNRIRIKRDLMGYEFEETGVIGSHTFNNAQKDKYD